MYITNQMSELAEETQTHDPNRCRWCAGYDVIANETLCKKCTDLVNGASISNGEIINDDIERSSTA
jgi:hypothetical protein